MGADYLGENREAPDQINARRYYQMQNYSRHNESDVARLQRPLWLSVAGE